MPISFQCRACGQRYRTGEGVAGRRVQCKRCSAPMTIPSPMSANGGPAFGTRSRILRQSNRQEGYQPAIGDPEAFRRISEHVREHLGPIDDVIHDLSSDYVHVDILCLGPTDERPFYTLVTCGMSDLPMATPPTELAFRHAEILICLPASWPMDRAILPDSRHHWPIRLLKSLARLPHETGTWLGFGQVVPSGPSLEPYAPGTKYCASLLLLPILADEAFGDVTIYGDKTVYFYSVVPLYREEAEFQREHGDSLVERLVDHRVTELLDLGRKNVCKKSLWPIH